MSLANGTRVRLAGGETGIVHGPAHDRNTGEVVAYIVRLDQRRSNGDGYDVLRSEEMEIAEGRVGA